MGEAASLSDLRARYARQILASAGLTHARVEGAFATVPRERHLNPPPWRIFSPGGWMADETSDPAFLYQDVLVVLDREKGINNGQPSLHAAWMAEVDPQPGESVVQIGIGTGYYTAILAELVGSGGRVDAYEIEPRLATRAAQNLAGHPQVAVRARSGSGAILPAADLIYVSAGAAAPDAAWLRSLREGGRLIFPWQPTPGFGTTLLATRVGTAFRALPLMGVSFVGCVGAGARDARPGPALPEARVSDTRSLHLVADRAPDRSATAIYAEVWFSTEPV